MKSISAILTMLVLSTLAYSQAPSKMSFQTVVRNSQGKLIQSKSIGIRLSILKTTSTGTVVYVETHTKTSNLNGLVTLEVGTGTISSGTFSTIDWSQGPYFLKTEMDVSGGSNYTISGVTEFVSVPYAINSKNADNANSVKTLSNGSTIGDMNYWNGFAWVPISKGVQGYTLTYCDEKPTWTVNGVCPGMISTLNCASITNNGVLIVNSPSIGVTSVISYTAGNGGVYNGQQINSTGVTGLTATLISGSFANGNGTLTYTITGTPNTNGIANFDINIGGKICTLTRNVLINAGAVSALDCSSAKNSGTLTASTTANAVSSVISYTGGNGGAYNGQIISSSVVTGLVATLKSGTFAIGNGNLTYDISGTPTTSGTANFTIIIGGKTCTLTHNVLMQEGVISSLDCSTATNTGTLTATTLASGVSSLISYTGGNAGFYNGQEVVSSGVTGLTATLVSGTLSNGKGVLTYNITGTPNSTGTANFSIKFGGQTCELTRNVFLSVGTVSSLNCVSATNLGTLTAKTLANGVTSVISYSGGNGGVHNGQEVTSTGVTGLTAVLSSNTFVNGNGSLTYTISGTPASNGTVSFLINIGGQTCTLSRSVLLQSGTISALNCNSATHNGTLMQYESAVGITSVIPYTGGNGGVHNGQVVPSTGVEGLTATLTSGGILSNGDGSLTYIIKGIPSNNGVANFAINIGGKNCELVRTVVPPLSGYAPSITDVDGNVYKTVYIGKQQWMAENLKTTKYNDGSNLPNVTDDVEWSFFTSGSWCYYNNDSLNNKTYGKLYNWYTVSLSTNGNRNICPTGWHIPSDAEFTVLTDYLGASPGGKMKEVGTTIWASPNSEATNTSLFTGLPAGSRNSDGKYSTIGNNAMWWSTTENLSNAWYRYLGSGNGSVGRGGGVKRNYGMSLRCLRD